MAAWPVPGGAAAESVAAVETQLLRQLKALGGDPDAHTARAAALLLQVSAQQCQLIISQHLAQP